MFKAIGIVILILLQHFNLLGAIQENILECYQLEQPQLTEYQDVADFNLPIAPAPAKQIAKVKDPVIGARSAIIFDRYTSEVVWAKDADKKRSVASLTKLMTALVVLDNKSLNDKVIVSKSDTRTSGTKMWLYQGEEITVANLLKGLLINSAADAAQTLARTTSGSHKLFVEAMNAKALDLGLENTHFGDPVGLNDGENYSTARELGELAKVVLQNSFLQEVVKTESATVKSTNGNLSHSLENTNELLNSNLNVLGIKTGYTKKAGGCLIALASGNKSSDQIITIVLNSQERFTDAAKLIQWTFKNYQW